MLEYSILSSNVNLSSHLRYFYSCIMKIIFRMGRAMLEQ